MNTPYKIITIDLQAVQSIAKLYQLLEQKLRIKHLTIRNWETLEKELEQLVQAPSHLIFHNYPSFSIRLTGAAEQLLQIFLNFDKKQQKTAILLDQLYEPTLGKKPTHVASLFDAEPYGYGLRGDPFLWKELKERFEKTNLPKNEIDLLEMITEQVIQCTGQPLQKDKNFFIEKYNRGGMSSGTICSDFWLNKAIPLLIGRFRQI